MPAFMIHGVMAEIPSTHYVKSDDVHIAYQVIGEGSFDLLFVPGFVSNVETIWQSPEQSAFFRRLASFSRLILFDKRGTGMSDRSSQIFTLEQRMHDVQAILDAVGSKRAALFGISEGGPMSLLYTATYPERTSALVLYGSYAKRSWAPDYPFGWKDEQWQVVLDDIEHNWGSPQSLSIAMRAPSVAGDPACCGAHSVLLPRGGEPGRSRCYPEDEPRNRCTECFARHPCTNSHSASYCGARDRCGACSLHGSAHPRREAGRASRRRPSALVRRSRRSS